MRHVVTLLAALPLVACGPTPKPFEHEPANDVAFHPKRDKNEVVVATPANMPGKLADKIASALALELQSYDIVAAVQPAQAPLKVAGATSTRDAGFGMGIEIQIEWYLLGGGGIQGPAVSKTVARPEDIADGNDRLVSRIAQQAAPRIATLMGKPPSFEARAPGQVAAGVNAPQPADTSPAQTAAATSNGQAAPSAATQAPPQTPRHPRPLRRPRLMLRQPLRSPQPQKPNLIPPLPSSRNCTILPVASSTPSSAMGRSVPLSTPSIPAAITRRCG